MKSIFPLALTAFVHFLSSASACNVPVFRYALERWENDPFQLIVFHDQPLAADLANTLSNLEPILETTRETPNWKIIKVDVTQPIPEIWSTLWQKSKAKPLPHLVLCTPEWTKEEPSLHEDALSTETLKQLTTSPKRREILKSIYEGVAVTWLVIHTADEATNTKLDSLMAAETKRLTDIIMIPPGIGQDGFNVLSKLPLEVSFRTITCKTNDPQETLLLKQLFNDEMPTQPCLFPIFGRGRALAAIQSEKLNADLLEEVARFLCGACSCQVKAQNPGFDLLLSTNWEHTLFGENEAPPPDTTKPATEPKYVPIPKGKKE